MLVNLPPKNLVINFALQQGVNLSCKRIACYSTHMLVHHLSFFVKE